LCVKAPLLKSGAFFIFVNQPTVMIEYKIPLWTIISSAVIYVASFAWFLIQLYYSDKRNNERIERIEGENKELKKELREIREGMLIVKNNVEHIMVGLLKNGRRGTRNDNE
jgi:Ca2+/Na+ antiporter